MYKQQKSYLYSIEINIQKIQLAKILEYPMSIAWRKGSKTSEIQKIQFMKKLSIDLKKILTLNLKLMKKGNEENFESLLTTFVLFEHSSKTKNEIAKIKFDIVEILNNKRKKFCLEMSSKNKNLIKQFIMELNQYVNQQNQFQESQNQEKHNKSIDRETMQTYDSNDEVYLLKKKNSELCYLNEKIRNDLEKQMLKNKQLERIHKQKQSQLIKSMLLMKEFYENKINLREQIYSNQIELLVIQANKQINQLQQLLDLCRQELIQTRQNQFNSISDSKRLSQQNIKYKYLIQKKDYDYKLLQSEKNKVIEINTENIKRLEQNKKQFELQAKRIIQGKNLMKSQYLKEINHLKEIFIQKFEKTNEDLIESKKIIQQIRQQLKQLEKTKANLSQTLFKATEELEIIKLNEINLTIQSKKIKQDLKIKQEEIEKNNIQFAKINDLIRKYKQQQNKKSVQIQKIQSNEKYELANKLKQYLIYIRKDKKIKEQLKNQKQLYENSIYKLKQQLQDQKQQFEEAKKSYDKQIQQKDQIINQLKQNKQELEATVKKLQENAKKLEIQEKEKINTHQIANQNLRNILQQLNIENKQKDQQNREAVQQINKLKSKLQFLDIQHSNEINKIKETAQIQIDNCKVKIQLLENQLIQKDNNIFVQQNKVDSDLVQDLDRKNEYIKKLEEKNMQLLYKASKTHKVKSEEKKDELQQLILEQKKINKIDKTEGLSDNNQESNEGALNDNSSLTHNASFNQHKYLVQNMQLKNQIEFLKSVNQTNNQKLQQRIMNLNKIIEQKNLRIREIEIKNSQNLKSLINTMGNKENEEDDKLQQMRQLFQEKDNMYERLHRQYQQYCNQTVKKINELEEKNRNLQKNLKTAEFKIVKRMSQLNESLSQDSKSFNRKQIDEYLYMRQKQVITSMNKEYQRERLRLLGIINDLQNQLKDYQQIIQGKGLKQSKYKKINPPLIRKVTFGKSNQPKTRTQRITQNKIQVMKMQKKIKELEQQIANLKNQIKNLNENTLLLQQGVQISEIPLLNTHKLEIDQSFGANIKMLTNDEEIINENFRTSLVEQKEQKNKEVQQSMHVNKFELLKKQDEIVNLQKKLIQSTHKIQSQLNNEKAVNYQRLREIQTLKSQKDRKQQQLKNQVQLLNTYKMKYQSLYNQTKGFKQKQVILNSEIIQLKIEIQQLTQRNSQYKQKQIEFNVEISKYVSEMKQLQIQIKSKQKQCVQYKQNQIKNQIKFSQFNNNNYIQKQILTVRKQQQISIKKKDLQINELHLKLDTYMEANIQNQYEKLNYQNIITELKKQITKHKESNQILQYEKETSEKCLNKKILNIQKQYSEDKQKNLILIQKYKENKLQLEKQLQQKNMKNLEKSKQIRMLKADLQSAQATNNDFEQKLQIYIKQNNECMNKIIFQQTKLKQMKSQYQQKILDMQDTNTVLNNIELQLILLKQKLNKQYQTNQRMINQKIILQQKIQVLESENYECKKQMQSLSHNLNRYKNRNIQLQTQQQQYFDTKQKNLQKIQQIKNLHNQLIDKNQQIQIWKKQLKKNQTNHTELLSKIQFLKQNYIKQLNQQLFENSKILRQKEKIILSHLKTINQLTEQIKEKEKNISKAKELNSLNQTLKQKQKIINSQNIQIKKLRQNSKQFNENKHAEYYAIVNQNVKLQQDLEKMRKKLKGIQQLLVKIPLNNEQYQKKIMEMELINQELTHDRDKIIDKVAQKQEYQYNMQQLRIIKEQLEIKVCEMQNKIIFERESHRINLNNNQNNYQKERQKIINNYQSKKKQWQIQKTKIQNQLTKMKTDIINQHETSLALQQNLRQKCWKIDQLSKQNEKMKKYIQQIKEQNKQYNSRNMELGQEIQSLQNQLHELKNLEIQLKDSQQKLIIQNKQRQQQFKQILGKYEKQFEQHKNQVNQLQFKIETLQKNQEILKQQFENSLYFLQQSKNQQIQQIQCQYLNNISRYDTQTSKLQDSLEQITDILQKKQAEVIYYKNQMDYYQKEFHKAKQDLCSLELKFKIQRQSLEIQLFKQKNKTKQIQEQLNIKIKKQQLQIDRLTNGISLAKNKIQNLTLMNKSFLNKEYEQQLKDLQEKLNQKNLIINEINKKLNREIEKYKQFESQNSKEKKQLNLNMKSKCEQNERIKNQLLQLQKNYNQLKEIQKLKIDEIYILQDKIEILQSQLNKKNKMQIEYKKISYQQNLNFEKVVNQKNNQLLSVKIQLNDKIKQINKLKLQKKEEKLKSDKQQLQYKIRQYRHRIEQESHKRINSEIRIINMQQQQKKQLQFLNILDNISEIQPIQQNKELMILQDKQFTYQKQIMQQDYQLKSLIKQNKNLIQNLSKLNQQLEYQKLIKLDKQTWQLIKKQFKQKLNLDSQNVEQQIVIFASTYQTKIQKLLYNQQITNQNQKLYKEKQQLIQSLQKTINELKQEILFIRQKYIIDIENWKKQEQTLLNQKQKYQTQFQVNRNFCIKYKAILDNYQKYIKNLIMQVNNMQIIVSTKNSLIKQLQKLLINNVF